MVNGTVKWFSDSKGYGFVTAEDGTDAFVHHTDIEGEGFKSLAESDAVEFEVTPGPKGPPRAAPFFCPEAPAGARELPRYRRA